MKNFKKYLSFFGQATRKEFWVITIVSTIVFIASMAILMISGIALDISAGPIFLVVSLLIVLFSILILMTMSRRLHDINYSGWLVLLFFVPFVGWLFLLMVAFFPSAEIRKIKKPQTTGRKVLIMSLIILGLFWAVFVTSVMVVGIVQGVMEIDRGDTNNKNGDIKITQDGNITNLETTGNLKITHKLKCLSPQDIKPEYTPADLMPAVVDCINNEKYENGVILFSVASLYGRFDMERVKDDTAHQAISALIANHLQFMDTPNKKEYNKFFKNILNRMDDSKDTSTLKKSVCEGILNVPMPTYFPSYMIYHGMDAFDTNFDVKNGVQEIDSVESFWNGLLKERFEGCF
jgi:uncharacterized membrane protein YhaH (DUF805 family)